MSIGLALQYVVVGVIVLASALAVLRKLAPHLTNRWLAAAAIALGDARRPRWLRAIGRHLQPPQATGDCNDGCGTCGACGPKRPMGAHPDAMPLEFRPRR